MRSLKLIVVVSTDLFVMLSNRAQGRTRHHSDGRSDKWEMTESKLSGSESDGEVSPR